MEIDRNGLEVLSRAECLRLVATSQVGRVVITEKALPAAFPVNFVLVGGDVLFLTGAGGKLEAATAGQVVAFEVDQIDQVRRTGWSVLIRGEAEVVDDPEELAATPLLFDGPWGGGPDLHLVRVGAEIVSGRRLVPRAAARLPVLAACPACGCEALLRVTAAGQGHFVCTVCAACWRVGDLALQRVEPSSCAGCSFKPMCTAAFARDAVLARVGLSPRDEPALADRRRG